MEAKPCSKQDDDGVSLPEDIIMEVLLRLPANALCRFRCVSKAWRDLISNTAFVAAQRFHAGCLIVAMFRSWPHYELRVLDMHGNVLRVFHDIDSASMSPTRLGLICISRMRLGTMIIDPAAGRVFTVGRNDDSDWSHSSFGRATPSGAYKVLQIHQGPAWGCEVATISDGAAAELTWRQRAPPPLVTSFSSVEHKVTINGVLYFMPYDTYFRTPGWNRIAAFDLESEVWMETINGPQLGYDFAHMERRIALTELNGTLCMVENIQDRINGPYAWVKAYMIRMPTQCLYIKLLDVLDDGRILLLNTSRSRYILQFFNTITKAFTEIMEMAEGFTGRMNFYTGSFLSS